MPSVLQSILYTSFPPPSPGFSRNIQISALPPQTFLLNTLAATISFNGPSLGRSFPHSKNRPTINPLFHWNRNLAKSHFPPFLYRLRSMRLLTLTPSSSAEAPSFRFQTPRFPRRYRRETLTAIFPPPPLPPPFFYRDLQQKIFLGLHQTRHSTFFLAQNTPIPKYPPLSMPRVAISPPPPFPFL